MRLLAGFLILFLTSCNYYEGKGLQSGSPGGVVAAATFATMTQTFFKPYCTRCHQGDDPAGGIDLTSYQAMIDDGISLVPGEPEKSEVYTLSRDGDMPKRGAKPSKELIEALRVWIADGAKEK